MWWYAVQFAAIVCFCICQSYQLKIGMRGLRLVRFALRQEAMDMRESLMLECKKLESGFDSSNKVAVDRLRRLRIIVNSYNALDSIANDLRVLDEQIERSTDVASKETAMSYRNEFLTCQEQIEQQLNAMSLDNSLLGNFSTLP